MTTALCRRLYRDAPLPMFAAAVCREGHVERGVAVLGIASRRASSERLTQLLAPVKQPQGPDRMGPAAIGAGVRARSALDRLQDKLACGSECFLFGSMLRIRNGRPLEMVRGYE